MKSRIRNISIEYILIFLALLVMGGSANALEFDVITKDRWDEVLCNDRQWQLNQTHDYMKLSERLNTAATVSLNSGDIANGLQQALIGSVLTTFSLEISPLKGGDDWILADMKKNDLMSSLRSIGLRDEIFSKSKSNLFRSDCVVGRRH